MLGAITGDIVGSIYEFNNTDDYNFELFTEKSKFTDDTILTIAQADSILNNKDWVDTLHEYVAKYPDSGYGGYFLKWALNKDREPYNSFGNGSAMRVSPVAWLYEDLQSVLNESEQSAKVTHNHVEGIKGAQATAGAIYLARKGFEKEQIKSFVENRFEYDLSKAFKDYIPKKELDSKSGLKRIKFNATCQTTIEPAIKSFLESKDFESCIRLSIIVGGDSDTIACIAGAIAEAFYGIPNEIKEETTKRLNEDFLNILKQFNENIEN